MCRLSSFPVDCLNDETVELLQPYLQSPDLEMELATHTCGTLVSGLYRWTHALCSYYSVNRNHLHTKVHFSRCHSN